MVGRLLPRESHAEVKWPRVYEKPRNEPINWGLKMLHKHDRMVEDPRGWQPNLSNNPREAVHYSLELRQLVDDCMRFKQKHRPSFAELLKRVQRQRSNHNQDLHDEPQTGTGWTANNILLDYNPPRLDMYTALASAAAYDPDISIPTPSSPTGYRSDNDEQMEGTPGAGLDG